MRNTFNSVRRNAMETEKGAPLVGDEFPEMEVQTTHGKMKLPDDFSGKWFVLFRHRADFTPVCTTEFVAFAKRYTAFKELNCELIGLSEDHVFSHMKWTEWIKENLGVEILFPIIEDSGTIATTLGVIRPGSRSAGVRATFVVDDNGIIRLAIHYPREIGRNMDEILRAVKALQVSYAHKVALPAGWPHNELIGAEGIIPPPTDEKTAKERTTMYECYDWWFCHKKLEE